MSLVPEHLRWFPAVVLSAALVACGGSNDETADDTTTTESLVTTTTTESTTTTGPPVLDSEQLDAAILTVDDLPMGWVADPRTLMASVHGGRICPTGRDELKTETHEGRTSSFARDLQLGPWVEQSITSAPDADEHFADHKNAATSCVGQTWNFDFDGELATASMVEISPPRLGDQQAAYRLTSEFSDGYVSVTEYTLLLNGLVLQEYWGVDDEFDPFQPGELADIVERGNAKVSDAITMTEPGST